MTLHSKIPTNHHLIPREVILKLPLHILATSHAIPHILTSAPELPSRRLQTTAVTKQMNCEIRFFIFLTHARTVRVVFRIPFPVQTVPLSYISLVPYPRCILHNFMFTNTKTAPESGSTKTSNTKIHSRHNTFSTIRTPLYITFHHIQSCSHLANQKKLGTDKQRAGSSHILAEQPTNTTRALFAVRAPSALATARLLPACLPAFPQTVTIRTGGVGTSHPASSRSLELTELGT